MGGHDYMKANLMDAKRRQVMDGVAVPEATLRYRSSIAK